MQVQRHAWEASITTVNRSELQSRLCARLIDARPLDFWWLSPRLPIPVQSRHVPLVSSDEATAVNIECVARYRATQSACSSSINIPKQYLVSLAATMPLGILQDRHLEHVPGTATLNDLDPIAALQEQADGRELKRSRNGTILVPQPSDDPNGIASACTRVDHSRLLLATILTCLCVADPLNYPLWRRDLITSILCLSSVIASTLSPLLAANTLALVLYYNTPESPGAPRPPPRSFTNVALLTGYHLLGVGVAGFIFVASARVWGKRHLYLLGTVIIIISSAWAGASGHNYNSLLAARFFQGVGLAPFGNTGQPITRYIFE
jgi:hypothetical protein